MKSSRSSAKAPNPMEALARAVRTPESRAPTPTGGIQTQPLAGPDSDSECEKTEKGIPKETQRPTTNLQSTASGDRTNQDHHHPQGLEYNR
ncbi:hypothetical protein PGT21_002520 [Puccinia graminis f. sp. tritici]|uniref:Uncharacterized protein n=1 Tax=Puccinia graminis f. sp. tritici TaxID=56615 RepID=A0A5B0LUV5_PUCGR|nr:hypothetical protein PGT21_002520 [Puccinia graminis f. sp. tritici]KAA1137860.1 hypothetical protein PGTUg99_026145 [Puccinia graminis f. sp. tritici]